MRPPLRLGALALILSCALWSCSGGAGANGVAALNPIASTPPVSSTAPGPVAASARFTITVPSQSSVTASSARTPKYVSPATQSIIITLVSVGGIPFTGSPASIATNLSTLNPACTGTTSLTCTVTAAAVVGSDVFSVVTYDSAQTVPFTTATGNVLSQARLSVAVVAGPNVVTTPLALNGVPASFTITPPAGTAGTAFSGPQAVIVAVKDAAGNTIVGSYANPVTLSDDDLSGATTLATSGSDNPAAGELLSSGDMATLTYTGLAIAPPAIRASASNATSGSGAFAPSLQPIVVTTSDAQNPSFAGVDLYATSGAGSSGSFNVAEAGWTNSPYNKPFTIVASGGCSTIASVAPSSGTSFTATVAGSAGAGTCTAALSDGVGQSQTVTFAYTNFAYTGASQAITVPAGVTSVTISAAGAQGGSGCSCSSDYAAAGGNGGSLTATVPVASATLTVLVGGQGGTSTSGIGGAGGFNGGAAGGSGNGAFFFNIGAGGGGGASAVMQGGAQLVVAGGGGGGGVLCGNNPAINIGGIGAYPVAGDGVTPISSLGSCGLSPGDSGGGLGGTQSAGGTGGAFAGSGSNGVAGGSGSGGAGGSCLSCAAFYGAGGGGGGGGYFGGGGGGASGTNSALPTGGGGGGSSHYLPSATNISTTGGSQSGNGSVVVSW